MYHFYKPDGRTIVSTTPPIVEGTYKTVNVALPNRNNFSVPSVVPVEVMPLGRKGIEDKSVGSIGVKRTADDKCFSPSKKIHASPSKSITSTFIQEAELTRAPKPVEMSLVQRLNQEASIGKVVEDGDDHLHALRGRSSIVYELLKPSGQYSQSSRPDAAELKVARKIIEREVESSRISSTSSLSSSQSHSNEPVKVPTPSSSVFAYGAEVHRQQLIQKDAILKQKTNSLPSSGVVGGQQVPTRQLSTIGKIGAKPTLLNGNSHSVPRSVVPQSVANYGVKPEPRNVMKTDGLKMVGNVLVNSKNILANAPSAVITPAKAPIKSHQGNLVTQILEHNNNATASNNVHKVTPVVARQQQVIQHEAVKKEKDLQDTIAALLNKKSINASDANDEWFESYSERMNKLAQREYMQEKASSVHSITIKAFQCCTCVPNLITEEMPMICRQKGHNIVSVSTLKQFFECGSCGKKDSTLGRGSVKVSLPPDRRCGICGSSNWIACGRYGSGPLSATSKDMKHGMSDLQGGRLILSASEWATRKDVVDMAVKTSTL